MRLARVMIGQGYGGRGRGRSSSSRRSTLNVREHLHNVALEKGLRQSTVLSYERLVGRLGWLDRDVAEVQQAEALDALWTIDNPNTRRAAVIALRSVEPQFGSRCSHMRLLRLLDHNLCVAKMFESGSRA